MEIMLPLIFRLNIFLSSFENCASSLPSTALKGKRSGGTKVNIKVTGWKHSKGKRVAEWVEAQNLVRGESSVRGTLKTLLPQQLASFYTHMASNRLVALRFLLVLCPHCFGVGIFAGFSVLLLLDYFFEVGRGAGFVLFGCDPSGW